MKLYKFFQIGKGKHCFIHIIDKGQALKIFDATPLENWDNLDDFLWGDPPKGDNPSMSVPLVEATKIQNIAWMYGLAPRVFDIVKVKFGNNKYWAQRVELATGQYAKDYKEFFGVYHKVKQLGDSFGFENEKDDVSAKDVIGGKLVDFNTFHFTKDHLEKVKKVYIDKARYGKVYYQDVPEWGLKGSPRKCEERVKYMKLGDINFRNKSVLDLGCAGGYFCRYARRQGTKDVIGIDYPDVKGSDPILAAKLVSNELGYWDIDYRNFNIKIGCQADWPSDIVFFLSMNLHIGIPDWLPKVTKEICIFEDNSKERNAKEKLTKMFKKVKLIGKAKDHGNKPIYWCFR